MRSRRVRSCLGVVFIVTFGVVYVGSIELTRLVTCSSEDFRLDCDLKNVLAIHKAYYTSDVTKETTSCQDSVRDKQENCTEDIRETVNKRCSGMAHCHYNFTEDHPHRKCLEQGAIVIYYACVEESLAHKFCNAYLKTPYGYILSPGYPRFYPSVQNCSWTLEANEGQVVIVSLLDVSMRLPRKFIMLNVCDDAVTVLEGSNKLLYSCGSSVDNLKTVESSRNLVTIQFKTENFTPSRGFIIYYKFDGCPTLPPPDLGYMVYRNRTSALYMCCKDHFFNDTMESTRYFHCVNGLYWNTSIVPCLTMDEIKGENITKLQPVVQETKVRSKTGVFLSREKYIEDILVPSALMVGLVVGNAAIVFVILRIRKKQKPSTENEVLQPIPAVSLAPRASLSDM